MRAQKFSQVRQGNHSAGPAEICFQLFFMLVTLQPFAFVESEEGQFPFLALISGVTLREYYSLGCAWAFFTISMT